MLYWEKAGPEATRPTLRAALKRARECGLAHLVVASNTGATVRALLAEMAGEAPSNIVCVTHHVGFREPGLDEMEAAERQYLESKGVKLLTTTHLFANVERAVTNQFGGLYPGGVVAATLRLFGQGMKVCVEIAVMALDAGLVPHGVDVLAVGGTGRGADTAVVIRPAHARNFFKTQVLETICRPRG